MVDQNKTEADLLLLRDTRDLYWLSRALTLL